MSMDAKKAREAMKAKAKRLAAGGSEKVDSSTFKPAEPLNADVKTGMRPVSRRAFKEGGKAEGQITKKNAGRKARKSGGKVYADALVNRNVKDANEEREGKKHIGGMKAGGRAKKNDGGGFTIDPKNNGKPVNAPLPPRRPEDKMEPADHYGEKGAKELEKSYARKSGGRTKKMGGGPMMDARLGIVKDKALPGGDNILVPGMKKGGKAMKHDDEKADNALIKKMVKPSSRTGKANGGVSKYLGNVMEREAAEKEYGPREEVLDRFDRQIKNEFSPSAMRKMRADRAKRMADDKGLQDFIERRKQRQDRDSLKDAGYKKGGKAKKAGGGMIEQTKRLAALKADPHNQKKIKPQRQMDTDADGKACGGASKRKAGGRVGKLGGGAMMGGARPAGAPAAGAPAPNANAMQNANANAAFKGPMGGQPGMPQNLQNRMQGLQDRTTAYAQRLASSGMAPEQVNSAINQRFGNQLQNMQSRMQQYANPNAVLGMPQVSPFPTTKAPQPVAGLPTSDPSVIPVTGGYVNGVTSGTTAPTQSYLQQQAATAPTQSYLQQQSAIQPIESALQQQTAAPTATGGAFGTTYAAPITSAPPSGSFFGGTPTSDPQTTGNKGTATTGYLPEGYNASGDYSYVRQTGGRVGRKTGGRAKGKGKTNINIVISQPAAKPEAGPMMPPAGAMPPAPPPPAPPAGGPPMDPAAMMAAMGGAGGPPMQPPPGAPPAFKKGGRVVKKAASYKDMQAGAGSGEGRLQKTDIAKRKK